MFQLSVQDIHPGAQAGDKEEAIRQVAAALVQAGNVADGYVNGMLAREQQTSTFLGNGIAIPHGTTDTRDQVLKTGVQVYQFPQGVLWGNGQVAYVAIGIAASSDEHLGLLRQLTHVLSDDDVAEQLKSATTAEELRALLMGEKQSEALKLDNETLTLDVVASDLVTLQALNAGRLKEAGAADATFVTRVINDKPLNLGQGIWLNDSAEGNLRSAIAVSRAANAFDVEGERAAMLVTVAMNDEQPVSVLKRLGDLLLNNKAEKLLNADAATLLAVAADPVRLTLLNRLAASGTRCVCDLQLDPPIPANLLSYHLRMLREAGLVTTARRGRWVDYTLAEDALERLHAALPVAAATRAECGSCR